jgi:hypothetical protein
MDNLVKLNEREVKLANIFWPGIGDGDFTPEGYALLKKYEKKVLEWCKESEQVKKSQEIQHDPESCKENGNSLTCSGSEELEKAAVEAYKKIVEKGGVSFLKIFKAGALWKENQFMKDAIVTCMQEDDLGDLVPTIGDMSKKGFKHGDKVKVIIIKEEQI